MYRTRACTDLPVSEAQGYLAYKKTPSPSRNVIRAQVQAYCRVLGGCGFLCARCPCAALAKKGGAPVFPGSMRHERETTLETTHVQEDGFFSQLRFKYYLPEEASVGDLLKICPWVASRVDTP